MADIKISQLGAAASISDSQETPVVDNGSTVKATMAQIKDFVAGGLANLKTTVKTSIVGAINEVFDMAVDNRDLEVTKSAVSSLPTTITAAEITSDMIVKQGDISLSNGSAMVGEWTITTTSGSVTISGSINGTTDITLYLSIPRTPA
jgi:hypothetical protein